VTNTTGGSTPAGWYPVKRRTGTGLAPLWIWIATIVVVFIVGIVWALTLVASLTSMAANLPTT
jgi:hypothetical protein